MNRKHLGLVMSAAFALGACLPTAQQPQATNPPAISNKDLRSTAAVLSQMTLQAIPTDAIPPSETLVLISPTSAASSETPTDTPNAILLTLTATLGTGTPGSQQPINGTPSTAIAAMTITSNPAFSATPPSPQPLSYGTLPPALPFGTITIYSRDKLDAYIALRCVAGDGNVTYLEYPVKTNLNARAPSGKYTYVVWVGGREFTGGFSLAKDEELLIDIYKSRVTVKHNN